MDDVADPVAPNAVRQLGQGVDLRAGLGVEEHQRGRVTHRRPARLGRGERGGVLRTQPLARGNGRSRAAPGTRLLGDHQRTPVAVGGIEVAAGVGPPALGVDRGVEVSAADIL